MNLQIFKQIFKYIVVGLCALAVDVSSFTVLRFWGADLIVSNATARLIGAITAYSGNHLWTFKQKKDVRQWLDTSWRYLLVWVCATSLSTLLIKFLIGYDVPETFAKLMVEMMMPILNFLISRYWIFKHQNEGA